MFDQLLDQFENVLAQASIQIQKNRPEPGNAVSVRLREAAGCDPTQPFGLATSFPKSQRFKQLPKEELAYSNIDLQAAREQPANLPTYSFPKKQRFQEQKPKYVETYINPNFAVVKKNITANVPVYKKSVGKDLAKSNVSVSTVDSDSFRGPGIYKIKEEIKVKNGVFLKDNRFKGERSKYEDTPLMINQNQTRKRPPSAAVMKKKVDKTRHLISKQQQQQLRERLHLVYWKNIPLELDRMFKNNVGPVLKEQYFNLNKLTGKQKRCAIIMLMDRLNYQRGGFQQEIRTKMDASSAVVYRRSTPKPFKFTEIEPGPDFYYPTDDLLRPSPPMFSFSKAGIIPKKPIYDDRDYQIIEQLQKKGGNIIINPVHQQHRLSDEQIMSLQRGPGFYDSLFGQVEKRADIGVVKFQKITQKNDRQNNCVDVKEVNDGLYFPSYQGIDPNVAVHVYRQPTNVQPKHLPDKVLFPQHWLFYDGDLNKVRAEIAKNVLLAKGMEFKEYRAYSQNFNRFKEYLNIQNKFPEIGEYEVSYKAQDPHIAEIDMQKMQQKTLLDPIVKPEGFSAGDNLILHPKSYEDKLPNVEFKKMVGRQDNQIDYGQPKEGDCLILNPNKPQKHVPNLDFKKQQGRAEENIYDPNYEGPQGDVLIINPKPVQKHIGDVKFQKQADRPQIKAEKDQLQQVQILNPIDLKPAIKGVPFSRLSTIKLVPLLRTGDKKMKQQNECD